ncbi:RNA polymerase sigma factor [Pedobacter insulae]|uniref:RNA polymerase sigma-70 factor, ECF subfamily n=1 Tax=Pedobacter insulae TaxID=414048 RepID=A0A1I3AQX1_9SPHI|nr:RNA polymerase sigma-70 factor [Pedobacter insulae]SFH51751.1 RNA polymerase sigma-70 factor, ECF subfamily [Pedobacter insulae]
MIDYQNLGDEGLASCIRKGDRIAFTEIYDRYWTVLYLHARKMLRNDQEAEDIVQELFTQLWKKAAEINYTVKLSSYLYRSVRNRILDHITHQKVVQDYQRSLVEFLGSRASSPDELLVEKELAFLIEQEIQALPEKMREVFVLSRKQHLSYKEIGDQLGISEHTVRNQVSNALSILRTKLGVSSMVIFMLLSK